ncbi:hypothetical protein HU200_041602 [Digitaria exilis]|uniref:Uncharacterized protein n=1 Tax=Digitaria exilis TaxID=1010633 RepID=A0A835B8N5_9POAL|nr:hypothetical protein HU200_041602 [Digitaria exilis]
MLVSWRIWKTRNGCIFDNRPARPNEVMNSILQEAML